MRMRGTCHGASPDLRPSPAPGGPESPLREAGRTESSFPLNLLSGPTGWGALDACSLGSSFLPLFLSPHYSVPRPSPRSVPEVWEAPGGGFRSFFSGEKLLPGKHTSGPSHPGPPREGWVVGEEPSTAWSWKQPRWRRGDQAEGRVGSPRPEPDLEGGGWELPEPGAPQTGVGRGAGGWGGAGAAGVTARRPWVTHLHSGRGTC